MAIWSDPEAIMAKRNARKPVDETLSEYEKLRPLYDQFTERLADLVSRLTADTPIKIHAIEKRTKGVDSLRQKITRPRKSYSDPLAQICDLSGIRVIVYYQEDVERVSKLIESEFNVDKDASGDLVARLEPNQFAYRSVHYVVSLTPQRLQLKEWKPFSGCRAEIQVRTVLQHAWAAISHALHYKHEREVPKPLSRRLFRLSGLLELADEEFSTLNRDKQAFAGEVAETFDSGIPDIPVDGTSLSQYMERGNIPHELEKKARGAGFVFEWDRTDDDDCNDSLSGLGWACSQAEILSIQQLDKCLIPQLRWADEYFKKLLVPEFGDWRVTRAFLVQLMILLSRQEKFTAEMLKERGWSVNTAEHVISVVMKVNAHILKK